MVKLLDYFPTEVHSEPRPNQVEALSFIGKCIDDKVKYIVLEAGVGSGKSAIATTLGRWSQDAVVVTPTKALQDQYRDDFSDIRLMKGRGAYPCTFGDVGKNKRIINLIKTGGHVPHPAPYESCGKSPCMNVRNGKRKKVLEECSFSGPCPYDMAIEVAQEHPIIVFNNWSYVFQTYHAGYFEKRRVMVLDECHDLEPFLRGMLSVNFTVNAHVPEQVMNNIKTLGEWVSFLKDDDQYNTISKDNQESYLERIERLEKAGEAVYGENPVIDWRYDKQNTRIELIPVYIGGMAHKLLFDYADIVVFMSGTIYDKAMFCAPLGIKPQIAAFLQLDSDFPVENRPVVRPRSMNELSYKYWESNLHSTVENIRHIGAHHSDQKGIIHTSSYQMANQLVAMLGPRFVTHDKESTAEVLTNFFSTALPKVLVSPVMSQGVDFKNDRARWQIIIRPNFLTPNDKFVKYMLDNGQWGWYNFRSLIVLGQQLGRIVRSADDYGVTYLLDGRFNSFLGKTSKWTQLWLKKSFIS